MTKLKIATLLSSCLFLCTAVYADIHVRGHTRSDGTVVNPHVRTNPNNSKSDNYSTQGNVNPNTGKPGYKKN